MQDGSGRLVSRRLASLGFAGFVAAGLALPPSGALAVPPVPTLHYDFNESGNAPGSSGSERRPLKMRNDAAGTALGRGYSDDQRRNTSEVFTPPNAKLFETTVSAASARGAPIT